MKALLIAVFVFSFSTHAAIESRMGFNLLDSPRMVSNSDFRASRDNFEVEVIIPFKRFIAGMAFENYGMTGQTENTEGENSIKVDLSYRRTAAIAGYRFAIGQYGPMDVTSDIMFTYGYLQDSSYTESVGNTSTRFSGELTPASSIYYLGTYGYGSIIGGLKVGYQFTKIHGFRSSTGETRTALNLSSPFIGLSLGFFL